MRDFDLKIPSLIIGLSIVLSVFINNYFSRGRYSFHHVGNEEYNNVFVSYLTDQMTGKTERIQYIVHKNPDKQSEVKSRFIRTTDMTTGLMRSKEVKSGIDLSFLDEPKKPKVRFLEDEPKSRNFFDQFDSP